MSGQILQSSIKQEIILKRLINAAENGSSLYYEKIEIPASKKSCHKTETKYNINI